MGMFVARCRQFRFRPDPFRAAEAILVADLRQNEIAVEGLRGFLVRTKQAVDRSGRPAVGCHSSGVELSPHLRALG